MRNDSTPTPDATPPRPGEIRENTPPAKLVTGDPPRQEFGDRTDPSSGESNPSRIDNEREPGASKFGSQDGLVCHD